MSTVTERDIEAISLIYRLHFVTIEQARMCVYKNRNVAQRRLSLLQRSGFLLSFPLSGNKKGHPTKVYYLNPKARSEIRRLLGDELVGGNIHSSPPDNLLVGRHHLELNSVLAAFIAGADSKGYELSFVPEYWVPPKGGGRSFLVDETADPRNGARRIRYRRDAVLCVGAGEGKALFELEYDRGAEVIRSKGGRKVTVARKLEIFLQSIRERRFERYAKPEYFGYPFRVSRLLVVTTSETRLSNIVRVGRDINTHGLVYLTTLERLNSSTVFGPIWEVPDSQESVSRKGLVRER
jgi:hypothetical protein